MSNKLLQLVTLAITCLAPLALAGDISTQNYLADVKYLASPELKGRATGTPELEKAADFIAEKFKSFGLKPADGNNFEVEFPVTLGAHLGTKNSLRGASAGEFQPFSFSSSGPADGQVAFVGFGVTDKARNYDDYAGIDVTGKFVIM